MQGWGLQDEAGMSAARGELLEKSNSGDRMSWLLAEKLPGACFSCASWNNSMGPS